MDFFEVNPEIYIEGWDEADVRQRLNDLLCWLSDAPQLAGNLGFFIPENAIRLIEEEAL